MSYSISMAQTWLVALLGSPHCPPSYISSYDELRMTYVVTLWVHFSVLSSSHQWGVISRLYSLTHGFMAHKINVDLWHFWTHYIISFLISLEDEIRLDVLLDPVLTRLSLAYIRFGFTRGYWLTRRFKLHNEYVWRGRENTIYIFLIPVFFLDFLPKLHGTKMKLLRTKNARKIQEFKNLWHSPVLAKRAA